MNTSVLSLGCGLVVGVFLAFLSLCRNFRTLREAVAHTAPAGKLSVIIASRNEEAVIENTLRTLARAAPEAEIIVVDGSTDQTPTILERLKKELPRLLVLADPYRRGKPAALNHALKHATGEIILFLDADARFSREAINFYASLAAHPRNPVIFADPFSYNSRRTFAVILQELFFSMARAFVFSGLFWRPIFTTCGLFVQRTILEKVGEFDQKSLVDDFDLGTRLARFGIFAKFVRGPYCLIQYAPSIPDLFRQFLRWFTGGIREMIKEVKRRDLRYLALMIVLALVIYFPWVLLWVDLARGKWLLVPLVLPGYLAALYWGVLIQYYFDSPPLREAIVNTIVGPPFMHLWIQALVLLGFFNAFTESQKWHKARREQG